MQMRQSNNSNQTPLLRLSSRNSDHPDNPHVYSSYKEYILSLIGFSVGFGSFWRFPYLVYKNGGGVFLIPYFMAMFLVGIPLVYLETAVGQMHKRSIPFIYARINKGLKMVGTTFLFICFHFSSYYNIILAYSYRFLFSVFHWQLPFANESPLQNHYFSEVVLKQSDSIGDFQALDLPLFFLYVMSLYICYLVIRKGVKSSGKIIMFTALMPYFFFSILLIRGLFLPGASAGLYYLFTPNWSKLFRVEIWIDAIVQVFYQMTVACSGIINLSSMKPKKEKYLIGIYLIPLSIVICGMMCAMNVFMYLGHFCEGTQLTIDELTLSGPALSFNIFPKALAILPWPNLWILCFFIAMVFLGIDSQFGYMESIFCYIKDQFRHSELQIYGYEINQDKAKKIIMCCILVFAPSLCSHAGIYYLQFYDSFVATIPLSLGALIEYYTFVIVFPFHQLQKQTQFHTGEKAPTWIKYLIEGRILFFILIINFGMACLNQFFYFFKYSLGFYLFGWLLTIYPYVLAYLYLRKYKEDKSRLNFKEINQTKIEF